MLEKLGCKHLRVSGSPILPSEVLSMWNTKFWSELEGRRVRPEGGEVLIFIEVLGKCARDCFVLPTSRDSIG